MDSNDQTRTVPRQIGADIINKESRRMNKIIFGLIGLTGYILFLVVLAVVAFRINFWLGLLVVSIEMMVTCAIAVKDKIN